MRSKAWPALVVGLIAAVTLASVLTLTWLAFAFSSWATLQMIFS